PSPRLAAHRALARLGVFLPIVGMDEAEPAPVPVRKVDRLHAEDPARLVRERHMPGRIVALPPADVRHALRRLEPRFALPQVAHGDRAGERVVEAMPDLLEKHT